MAMKTNSPQFFTIHSLSLFLSLSSIASHYGSFILVLLCNMFNLNSNNFSDNNNSSAIVTVYAPIHVYTRRVRNMYAESKSRHDYLNMMRKSEHKTHTHTHNAHGIELKHTKAIILIIPMPPSSGEKISNSLTLNYCFVHVLLYFQYSPSHKAPCHFKR